MAPARQHRIVKVITLDLQRRHIQGCSSYGIKPYKDCPTASKKKCPYRLFGYGLDEQGHRQRIRLSLGLDNWQEATEKLNQYRQDIEGINSAAVKPTLKPSVEEAMALYFKEESARGVSSETLKSFHKFLDRKRDAERFTPTLIMYTEAKGIKLLNQITPDHIKEWRGQWVLGAKTREKQWERVRQFFQYAEDAAWIDVNPAAKIRGFAKSRDDLPVTALSESEVKVILAACGKDEFSRTFLMTLRHSGMAIVDAIQLKPGRLTGESLQTYRTKTGVQVEVVLPPQLVERLNALPVQERGYWFWNRKIDGSNHQTATGNMRRRLRPIL